jgi:hypothetical protein
MQKNITENPYWDGFVLGAVTMLMLASGLALFFLAPNLIAMAAGLGLAFGSLLVPLSAIWQFRKRAKPVPVKVDLDK